MLELFPVAFAAHLAATGYMTGLICFVQMVHYPLMSHAEHSEDKRRFAHFESEHVRRTGVVVMPAMLIELATLLFLLVLSPNPLLIVSAIALLVIWLATFLLSVPCHNVLATGFDQAAHRRLVRTNWIRTAGWSLRLLLLLVWLIHLLSA